LEVSCAGIAAEMHIVMATSTGGLFHATRLANGSWTGLGDVNTAAGQIGYAAGVSVTNFLGELNLVARTLPGNQQFHTIRHTSSWSAFATPPNNFGALDQACAGTQDFLHVVSIETTTGTIRHRTRDAVANWSPVGNVSTVTGFGSAQSAGASSSLGY
jgi:hypothetical protein